MMHMLDNVASHKFIQRAIRGMLKIYLHLIDSPEDIDGLGHLNTADRKKEKIRLKKQRDKEKKLLEEKEKEEFENAKWDSASKKEKDFEEERDSDPFGEKFLLQKNFLQEASVLCQYVSTQMVASEADTLALIADVMIRKGKFTPALRALSCGLQKQPYHPGCSLILVKYASKVGGGASAAGSTATAEVKPVIQSVIKDQLSVLLSGTDVSAFVHRYITVACQLNSLSHRVAAARMLASTDKTIAGKTAAVQLIVDDEAVRGRGVSVHTLTEAMHVSMIIVNSLVHSSNSNS